MLLIAQNDLKHFTGYHPEAIDGLPIKLNGCVDDPGTQIRFRILTVIIQPGAQVLIPHQRTKHRNLLAS